MDYLLEVLGILSDSLSLELFLFSRGLLKGSNGLRMLGISVAVQDSNYTWYCWYSEIRSFMLDSASVNSISSIPSPVYQ